MIVITLFTARILTIDESIVHIEWVELMLLNLHAHEGLIPTRIVDAKVNSTSACLEKTVENATKSINFIDRLEFRNLFLMLALPHDWTAEMGDLGSTNGAASTLVSCKGLFVRILDLNEVWSLVYQSPRSIHMTNRVCVEWWVLEIVFATFGRWVQLVGLLFKIYAAMAINMRTSVPWE